MGKGRRIKGGGVRDCDCSRSTPISCFPLTINVLRAERKLHISKFTFLGWVELVFTVKTVVTLPVLRSKVIWDVESIGSTVIVELD